MKMPDDPNRYLFWDTETRSLPGTPAGLDDVTKCGAYAYSEHAKVILLSYCIGDGPVQRVELTDFDKTLRWADLPQDFRQFAVKALVEAAGENGYYMVAWNAAFDRLVTSRGIEGAPEIPPGATLDAMAQAVASNLPPSLQGSSTAMARGGKVEEGKDLIKLFCSKDGATPQQEPEKWALFGHYADVDVEEMRAVFWATRRLTWQEWQVYWANEEINDRGMMIDLDVARGAAALADAERERVNAKMAKETGGVITAVTQVARLTSFIYNNTPHSEVRKIMEKVAAEEPENEEDDYKPAKLGLDRPRIERLLVFYDALEERQDGLDDLDFVHATLLELRLYGGSSTPAKFAKMLLAQTGGRLRGQYVFNGAQQTGRFSSRGVQIHNLTRSHLAELEEVVLEILGELGEQLEKSDAGAEVA